MAIICPKFFFGERIVDQKSARIDITSSAVLYGLSVYTVFPVSEQSDGRLAAFRLMDHFQRLQDSAKIIGIDGFNGWRLDKFRQATKQLVTQNKIQNDVFVRASVHVNADLPGTRSRGLKTVLSMFAYDAEPILPQQGARLKTSVWRRIPDFAIPSRAKVNGAYVNSVLAKQDAIDSGYDDCIFLDSHGHVCELSAANIFIVRNGELITPDTGSDILEGISLKTIIALANEEGIAVKERSVDLTELYVADEVFACGTSAYVCPILEVDARRVSDGKAGPITTKIRKMHQDVLRGLNPKHADWLTVI